MHTSSVIAAYGRFRSALQVSQARFDVVQLDSLSGVLQDEISGPNSAGCGKYINVALDDADHERLNKKRGKKRWPAFIMELAK